MILETEGGTQPEDECVEERLQKVRGWRALEGRSRKAEPLNKPPVHPGVSNPPPPTGVIKLVSGFARPSGC